MKISKKVDKRHKYNRMVEINETKTQRQELVYARDILHRVSIETAEQLILSLDENLKSLNEIHEKIDSKFIMSVIPSSRLTFLFL